MEEDDLYDGYNDFNPSFNIDVNQYFYFYLISQVLFNFDLQ